MGILSLYEQAMSDLCSYTAQDIAAAKREGARELANLLMVEIGVRLVAGFDAVEVLEIVTAKCVSLIDSAEPKKEDYG